MKNILKKRKDHKNMIINPNTINLFQRTGQKLRTTQIQNNTNRENVEGTTTTTTINQQFLSRTRLYLINFLSQREISTSPLRSLALSTPPSLCSSRLEEKELRYRETYNETSRRDEAGLKGHELVKPFSLVIQSSRTHSHFSVVCFSEFLLLSFTSLFYTHYLAFRFLKHLP